MHLDCPRPPARPDRAAVVRPAGAGPILVTGAHRSGSTWVGTVLALADEAGYIPEPFNRRNRPGICRAGFPQNFFRLTDANAGPYRAALADTLDWRYSPRAELRQIRTAADLARMLRDAAYFRAKRARGARPVMKDPIALFSADWLARSFDMQVVTVIRHPAAFVASLRAAGWSRFPFTELATQPALMQGCLAPFAAEIAAAARTRPAGIDGGVLIWRLLHHQIARYQAEQSGWIFVRHEDLSADPDRGFRRLYAALGLRFTPAVAAELARMSGGPAAGPGRLWRRITRIRDKAWLNRDSQRNIRAWKRRLAPDEIARIRAGTADIAGRFYGPEDW